MDVHWGGGLIHCSFFMGLTIIPCLRKHRLLLWLIRSYCFSSFFGNWDGVRPTLFLLEFWKNGWLVTASRERWNFLLLKVLYPFFLVEIFHHSDGPPAPNWVREDRRCKLSEVKLLKDKEFPFKEWMKGRPYRVPLQDKFFARRRPTARTSSINQSFKVIAIKTHSPSPVPL